MKESGVIRIKEHPKLMREAALWFHEKWGEVPVSAYFESMKESLSGETSVPGWYLYITGGSIAAGAGVIENDFHDRKDLGAQHLFPLRQSKSQVQRDSGEASR